MWEFLDCCSTRQQRTQVRQVERQKRDSCVTANQYVQMKRFSQRLLRICHACSLLSQVQANKINRV